MLWGPVTYEMTGVLPAQDLAAFSENARPKPTSKRVAAGGELHLFHPLGSLAHELGAMGPLGVSARAVVHGDRTVAERDEQRVHLTIRREGTPIRMIAFPGATHGNGESPPMPPGACGATSCTSSAHKA